jgi:AcrR family transcriptional regulator
VTEVRQRPLRSDAERNRRLVLDAAAQAFAEEGLEVGMAEIARRAGVGNATVFRRFPTKDALYEAIVDEKIAELVTAGATVIEPLVVRAQEAGVVREDVTTVDVLGLVKGAVACVPPSPALRADGWRRPLAIVLDALRPEGATPLPIPPLSYEEIEQALGIASEVERA